VIFPGGDGWIRSYEPKTGEPIWQFDCNPKDSVWELGRGDRNSLISTAACVDGIVYIAVGQDPEHGEGEGHLYAIDASLTGDITEKGKLWHYGGKEFRRTVSSFAVTDDLLYAADLSGFFHCLDRKTGRPKWVYDTFAEKLFNDPVVGKRFFGMSDDSREGFRQKNKNLVCNVTGEPCKIISRPAATAHGGLGIKASEFGIVAQHLVDTLNEFKVPEKEHKELMAIIATLRPDIVEVEGE